MKEWQKTLILLLLLGAGIAFLVLSANFQNPLLG